jgi:23S rRNA U2552 (ribose-2'-O)-methylase RlmE/FtsJ
MVEIYHALDGARKVLRSKGAAVTSAFYGEGAVRFLKALTASNTKAFFDAPSGVTHWDSTNFRH